MTRKEQLLIQNYLDGELSKTDNNLVEGLIKDNPELRRYYEDLSLIESALSEDEQSKADIDLKDQIMNEILKNKQEEMKPLRTERVFDRLFPNLRWNIAYAFVFGIVIGALVVTLATKQTINENIQDSYFSGAMSNSISGDVFSLPIDMPGMHINISADKLQENYYKVLVDVNTEEPGMVNMTFNKSGFYIQSIKMLKESNDCRITSNRSSVQMFNQGENKFLILMKKLSYLPEEINVQVFLDEMIKYENTVTIN